jgi:hypothetical protein
MFISKLKATAIHLFFSLSIFSFFISILYFFWFPEPYFTATGGWQGLTISAMIDMVLGPLLTFITYNALKPKRELFFDFSIIILIQLAALIWGIHTISQQRPIAIAFWEDSLFTVPKKFIEAHYPDNKQADKLVNSPLNYYYVKPALTIAEKQTLIKRITEDKIAPHFQIEHYQSFTDNFKEIKKHSVDIQEIIDINKSMKSDILSILELSNSKLEDNIYLRLRSKYQNVVLVFNQDAKMIGYAKAPFFE